MYCPKCAQSNGDNARFCRGCGENLSVVAQALSKHLPVTLVSKLDEHIEEKHNRIRRDGVMTGLSGIFLLFGGIWQITTGSGAWLSALFMFLGALILLLSCAWDLLAYKRSRSTRQTHERSSPSAQTGKLDESSVRHISPASVVEQTTRHFTRNVGHTG